MRRCSLLVVALLVSTGCAGGDGDEGAAGSTTTTAASEPDLTLPPPPEPDPDLLPFPPARTTLEHGGSTPAAVLAASTEIDGADIEEAVEAAAAAGYQVGPTDCDSGAEQAFGFGADDVVYTVSVYFETDEEAVAAVAAFESRGTNAYAVTVQTFCLD